MNIRFPKKNIAQQQAERARKPKSEISEPLEHKIVIIPEEKPPEYTPILCVGPSVNSLYPMKLHRLHEDVELLGRLSSLPKKERQELQKRLPPSLVQAETKADKILEDFVRHEVKKQGQRIYGERLKKAMTEPAQIMLALRCWIAAKTIEAPRNTIQIFRNKKMEAWEFFPASARKDIVDPITGATTIFIDYETDEEKPYERQEIVKSQKHYQIAEILDPGPKKIDQLPKNWAGMMDEILNNYGHEIETLDGAWSLLEKISRDSSVEDRILSKIAYLITHASATKQNKRLPG